MMRELSAHVPVLYINSIGMRVPRLGEGAVFLRRIARKLKSFRRGLARIDEGRWVLSPLTMPGRLRALTRSLLPRQVKRGMRRAGIRRPLVWVACPPGAEFIDDLDPVGVVYQRTDRFEAFHGVDVEHIKSLDRTLKALADVTLYCSSALIAEERDACRHAEYVDHGVDYDRFAEAGDAADRGEGEPDDLKAIARPRVGFVGGIDAHTFDPPLFTAVAKRLPDLQFVLVGGCSLPEEWCDRPNVHLLGRRDYSDVAAYMAACEVLIMPWNQGEWIRVCNPVKLKEYLAVGRPVVTTWFDELSNYEGLVRVADGPEQFSGAIRDALGGSADRAVLRRRVEAETWSSKADDVLVSLARLGLVPERTDAII
jgi:glycosyltransferase involved in cell wall biosynthesis